MVALTALLAALAWVVFAAPALANHWQVVSGLATAEALVLLLALQHVVVQLALEQGRVQGWCRCLDIQGGLAAGRGEGACLRHVGISGQGLVGVCPCAVE